MQRIIVAGAKGVGKTDFITRFHNYCKPYASQFLLSEVEMQTTFNAFLRSPEYIRCLLLYKSDDHFMPMCKESSHNYARNMFIMCANHRVPVIMVPTMVTKEHEHLYRNYSFIPAVSNLRDTKVYAKPIMELMNFRNLS